MSIETVLYIIGFTFFGSILSLVGSFVLLSKKVWSGETPNHLLAFASGVLIATSFLDLLPEALHESGGDQNIFVAALLGIVVFFFLERALISFHPHEDSDQDEIKQKSLVGLVLFGDGFHNFIDGFVIAGSFLVSIELGVITAVAVAAHEIPQEISDFTILLRSGMKVSRAVWLNILSGLTALVGAVLTIFLSSVIEPFLGLILAFTGGMFIYIAAANLIPELQHIYLKERKWHQTAYFLFGIAVIFLTINFLHFE